MQGSGLRVDSEDEPPIPTLQPEIWIDIIEQLRRPRPLVGEGVQRSDIRQHDLTIVMRVSKELNNITAPILYRSIITDDIPLLLYSDPDRITPDIKTKQQLLELTKRLFIEYPALDTRPTYMTAMRNQSGRMWEEISVVEEEKQEILRNYSTAACTALTHKDTLHHHFPSLETLSIAAHFDAYAHYWRKSTWDPTCEEARKLRKFIKYTVQSGRLRHFCQSDTTGPFTISPTMRTVVSNGQRFTEYIPSDTSLLSIAPEADRPVSCTLDVHLTQEIMRMPPYLPVLLGQNTRWYLNDTLTWVLLPANTPGSDNGDRPVVPIHMAIGQSLSVAIKYRDASRAPDSAISPDSAIHPKLYLPPLQQRTRRQKEREYQQSEAGDRERDMRRSDMIIMQEGILLATGPSIKNSIDPVQDHIDFVPTFDYPGCRACGWAPRRARGGRE